MLERGFHRPLLNTEIRRRGIYLLPNLFTTTALFAGFYAIVMAMNQRFDNAAVAIFIAMILDFLDGRVARLTRTQSAFGAEYDSLSDMVCFGAAPALVIYEWALIVLGFVLVSSDPPIVLFLLFVAYGLSGYAHWLWKKRKPQQPAQLQ